MIVVTVEDEFGDYEVVGVVSDIDEARMFANAHKVKCILTDHVVPYRYRFTFGGSGTWDRTEYMQCA